MFILNEWNICTIQLIPYFLCTHIHTSSLKYVIYILYLSPYYCDFYYEVTLFFVEKIFVIINVSQVFPVKAIQSFWIKHVNNILNNHMINNYCYRHNYFTIYALQAISLIFCWVNWPLSGIERQDKLFVLNA